MQNNGASQDRAADQDRRGPQDRLAARVAELAGVTGRTVAVAESLTGGMIATALAAAEGAGDWFRGALVAYAGEVKHELLGVPDGPVVSAEAAWAMARGVRRLLGADVGVAVTGVGGPTWQDGRSPGTVFIAVAATPDEGAAGDGAGGVGAGGDPAAAHHELPGEPVQVCAASAELALQMLLDRLDRLRRADAAADEERAANPT